MLRNISPIKNSDSMKSDSFFSDDEELQGLTIFEKIEHKEMKHTKKNFNELINTKLTPKKEKTGYNELSFELERMNIDTKCSTKITSDSKNKSNKLVENINHITHINDEEKNLIHNYDNFVNITNGSQDKYIKEDLDKLDDVNINKDNPKYAVNKLLGKKRNPGKIKIKNKEEIYKQIKILFDKYNKKYPKKNEILPSYKIYEESNGIFKKHATIVQNKIPGCVIYFHKHIIQKMFLIREQKVLEEANEIEKILEYIRDNMPIIS
jgi:hypothetical protein